MYSLPVPNLTNSKLSKMSDDEVLEAIYSNSKVTSNVNYTRFYVNGGYVRHTTLAATFNVNPIHVRYVYEVIGISSARDILRYLCASHYEGAFGVCTLGHLASRSKELTKPQILNLLALGKSPSEITHNAFAYRVKYRKDELPQGESSLFA